MEKTSGRRDTFFVRPSEDSKRGQSGGLVQVMTLPDGQRVHALDRDAFDRAVRAAMKPRK